MNPHICVVYYFYLTLSLSQWKIFFLYHSRVCTWGQGGFFSFWKFMSKNNKGACQRPHIMAGCRFPSVLSPCVCRAQRTLYLFVGLFVVVALSPKTPAPHRPIYHCHHPGSSIWLLWNYINMKSYDYMISYPPPTSLIVENDYLFRVTRHIMIQVWFHNSNRWPGDCGRILDGMAPVFWVTMQQPTNKPTNKQSGR